MMVFRYLEEVRGGGYDWDTHGDIGYNMNAYSTVEISYFLQDDKTYNIKDLL